MSVRDTASKAENDFQANRKDSKVKPKSFVRRINLSKIRNSRKHEFSQHKTMLFRKQLKIELDKKQERHATLIAKFYTNKTNNWSDFSLACIPEI